VSEETLRRNFGKLHAMHVAALTRHLVECRRFCDGDLEMFLVLAIIGERTFTARNAPDAMSHADFLEGSVRNLEPAAINLQSIADYSGIPRETVRRKVESLIEKGWVMRDERKFVTATDKAKDNLVGLTESTLRYLRDLEIAFEASRTG
jgi:CRP-like cAMP-binding protein